MTRVSPRAQFHGKWHEYNPKLCAYSVRFREDAHHLFRRGIGSDVVIGGLTSEQQVAHTSPDQIGLVAPVAQSADDRDGELFH